MQLSYYAPSADLRHLAGTYYELDAPEAVEGTMRAEGPNFRCLLSGRARLVIGGEAFEAMAPGLYLIGPTSAAYRVELSAGTVLFGASLTPLGWFTAMGEGADALADSLVPYADHHPDEAAFITAALLAAADTAARVRTADTAVRATAKTRAMTPSANGFVEAALDWFETDTACDVGALAARTGLSVRQVERLSKTWFGAGPKLLQRKYRALRTCDRLAANPGARWSDVADPAYTDQSHMIREFRRFIGCTPGEFARHDHSIIRETLAGRQGTADDGVRYLA